MASLSYSDSTGPVEHYPSTSERRADKAVHLVGMAMSAAAGVLLSAHALDRAGPSIAGGIALYAGCAIAMLAASALYNLAGPSGFRGLLRRIDETAIFIMIAGTCAPYLLTIGPRRWEAEALEWAIAAVGAGLRLTAPRWPHWTSLYIGYAVVSLALAAPSVARLPAVSLACLAVVVATYGAGVCAFLSERLPYRRAVWHATVVAAMAVGFGALATGLVRA